MVWKVSYECVGLYYFTALHFLYEYCFWMNDNIFVIAFLIYHHYEFDYTSSVMENGGKFSTSKKKKEKKRKE